MRSEIEWNDEWLDLPSLTYFKGEGDNIEYIGSVILESSHLVIVWTRYPSIFWRWNPIRRWLLPLYLFPPILKYPFSHLFIVRCDCSQITHQKKRHVPIILIPSVSLSSYWQSWITKHSVYKSYRLKPDLTNFDWVNLSGYYEVIMTMAFKWVLTPTTNYLSKIKDAEHQEIWKEEKSIWREEHKIYRWEWNYWWETVLQKNDRFDHSEFISSIIIPISLKQQCSFLCSLSCSWPFLRLSIS